MRDIHTLQMMSTKPLCVIKKLFYLVVKSTTMSIAKNLVNTNGNTNEIFSLVNYSKFYQQNMSSQYPSINTDGNIPSIYIERITHINLLCCR